MTDTWLETLSYDRCIELLRAGTVGRLAVIDNGYPVVVPVNYRLVETTGPPWIAIRTRAGNVVDQRTSPVAFEIDSIDVVDHRGWSVLVRGTLHHVNPNTGDFRDRFDPQPWLDDERDAWLVIEPFSVTGRELHTDEPHWSFHLNAYL